MKKLFFLFNIVFLFLIGCGNKSNNIKSIKETSTALASNISNVTNITLANPDDICPINMPFNNLKEYDKNGLLTKEIFYNSDGLTTNAFTYEYSKGLETKKIQYSANGTEENSIISEYENGKISKSTNFTAFGTVSYTDNYYYQDGQTIQTTSDENGNLFCKVRSSFDSKGNKTKEEIVIYGVGITITYKYDDKNQLIEQTESDNTRWIFTYDKYGNMKEKKCIYTDGSISVEEYEYKYDNHNNWIEKTCYYDKKPIFKTDRLIEYYN